MTTPFEALYLPCLRNTTFLAFLFFPAVIINRCHGQLLLLHASYFASIRLSLYVGLVNTADDAFNLNATH